MSVTTNIGPCECCSATCCCQQFLNCWEPFGDGTVMASVSNLSINRISSDGTSVSVLDALSLVNPLFTTFSVTTNRFSSGPCYGYTMEVLDDDGILGTQFCDAVEECQERIATAVGSGLDPANCWAYCNFTGFENLYPCLRCCQVWTLEKDMVTFCDGAAIKLHVDPYAVLINGDGDAFTGTLYSVANPTLDYITGTSGVCDSETGEASITFPGVGFQILEQRTGCEASGVRWTFDLTFSCNGGGGFGFRAPFLKAHATELQTPHVRPSGCGCRGKAIKERIRAAKAGK
jgi:hypothetical protein